MDGTDSPGPGADSVSVAGTGPRSAAFRFGRTLGRRSQRSMASAPAWWRPGIALLGLGVSAAVLAGTLKPDQWGLTGGFIIASGLVLLPTILLSLRRPVEKILSDHLLLLSGVFIAYFVVGGLLIPFGPQDAVDYALSYYWLNAPLALRATAVNCVGMGLVLVSSALLKPRWIALVSRRATRLGRSLSEGRVIAALVVVGSTASFFVFQLDLGLATGTLIPGLVRMLAQLLNVAIVIAASRRGRHRIGWMALAFSLVLIQATLGLVLLNKTVVLIPFAALLAGLALRLGVRRVLLPGTVGLLVLFLVLGNSVNIARNQFGIGKQVRNWGERVVFLWDAMASPESRKDDRYFAWSRFCYLPAQGAALDLYDLGQGGEDFSQTAWVFVPRFLFSDKPILSSGGVFELKVTGVEGSASAPGVFADGYFNRGWWGVLVVGLSLGCMLACTSGFAHAVFRSRALIWLPVALSGNIMAFRIDGTFLSDYAGPFVTFAYVVAGAWFLAGNRRQRGTLPP